MYKAKAYAAASASSPLAFANIQRREPTPDDVQIDILFCGVCHSDLHQARDEWHSVMPTVYPCVPGHEILGRVAKVGSAVKKFKVGDLRPWAAWWTPTATARPARRTWSSSAPTPPSPTTGRTNLRRCDVRRLLRQHGGEPALCAACAGESGSRRSRAAAVRRHHHLLAAAPLGRGPGKKVGVVGLGGLGHMGVKFSHALGAHTVVFTTSPEEGRCAASGRRRSRALHRRQPDAEARLQLRLHPGRRGRAHDINPYLHLLKIDGNLTLVGAPEKPLPVKSFGLIFGRKSLSGSLIGGIEETQEMLDFCGQHNITSDVEVIPIQKINEAYERMLRPT